MEAIGKNIDSSASKNNLVEVENNGKPGLTSNRKSSSSIILQWLPVIAVICFTLFFMAIFIKQEYEIKAIRLEMESFTENNKLQSVSNMLDNNNQTLKEPKHSGNQSDAVKAIHSRRRRQTVEDSDSLSQVVPFAHLSGSVSTPGDKLQGKDFPYHWSNWTTDSPLNSHFALVQMHRTTKGHVQAIRVVCSGWYYVYAQLPYSWKANKPTHLGHSIVKIDKCGQDKPVTVLQTYAYPEFDNTTQNRQQDWRYVGGIVYLSASTHVEVRGAVDTDPGCCIDTSHTAKYNGGFFGLYMIQRSSQGSCFSGCEAQ